MVYKVPSTMVGGYCTLFLIKIDLWSGGGLPIDLSPLTNVDYEKGAVTPDHGRWNFVYHTVYHRIIF